MLGKMEPSNIITSLIYSVWIVSGVEGLSSVANMSLPSMSAPYRPTSKFENNNDVIDKSIDRELSGVPPYSGTINLNRDILDINRDTNAFDASSVTFAGQDCRKVFDRRVDDYYTTNAYIFQSLSVDGMNTEWWVHEEYGSETVARQEVEAMGRYFGTLPAFIRIGIKFISVLKGEEAFGGPEMGILIHSDYATSYISDGIMEEVLFHEAVHGTLDPYEYTTEWSTAASQDNNYISTYARDNPTREDIAESVLPWMAVKYRASVLLQSDIDSINAAIPNRLVLLDNKNFDMWPVSGTMQNYAGDLSHHSQTLKTQFCSFRYCGSQRCIYESGSGGGNPPVIDPSAQPCFSPFVSTNVLGKGVVTMKDIEVGDQVLTASGEYKTIFTISHFHNSRATYFIQIHSKAFDDSNEENGDESIALELTSNHMLFVHGRATPVPASDVKIGDILQSLSGPQQVTNITSVIRNGLYSPITTDGTIVAGNKGIIASTYTTYTGTSHIEIANRKSVSFQMIADLAYAPYKAVCLTVSLEICNQHTELAGITQVMKWVYNQWSAQNEYLKFVIFTIYMVGFGIMNIIVNFPLGFVWIGPLVVVLTMVYSTTLRSTKSRELLKNA